MSELELTDFEIFQELGTFASRQVFEAKHRSSGELVRLTVFSAEMSRHAEFRRAMKTDRAMLSMLVHQSIVRFLGSGESAGQLFFWTEACEFDPLTSQLEQQRTFSAEDVIEIGWQICSALQHSHNLGLAHGGLTAESVCLSESLQVMLVDFGVTRWLRAAREGEDARAEGPALITVSALASRADIQGDLAGLATILWTLLQSVTEASESSDAGRSSTRVSLEKLLSRVSSSNAAQQLVSAREFQGRLGEILIGTEDDTMPLVDQRESLGTSKRSIVDELFELTAAASDSQGPEEPPASSASRKQILPIIAIIAIIVIVTMLAGLLP